MPTTAPAPPVLVRRLALPGDRHTPAVARLAAARLLERAGWHGARAHDALLVVSELVTNAVRHAPGPCLLSLTERDGVLVVAVSDRGEDLPHRWAEGGERGGFGLPLIERLGGRLTVVPSLDGKTVRVRLDRTEQAPPDRTEQAPPPPPHARTALRPA
ncbi:ATP-binding protein [Streptomyces sp. NPDC048182]|uniref:ATP-binding protein n=1 Tax=Streptomyces sp. NPDC048182 TaxID=3365507 RepID=UPI0037222217